jgi:hypothetical protein
MAVRFGAGTAGLDEIPRRVTGDLDATITDANSVVHDVSVIGLFRAYPDHTSWYARDSLDRSSANLFGGLEPYDGMYWATLQLTALGGAPLPLAPGPATIAITSTELVDTGLEFGFGYSEGTLASFPIEILEGTRVPTYEETQQYTAYRSQRGLTIAEYAGRHQRGRRAAGQLDVPDQQNRPGRRWGHGGPQDRSVITRSEH